MVVESGLCAFKSRTPNAEYVYQGSGKYFPNKDWKDCVQDSTEYPMPTWSVQYSHDNSYAAAAKSYAARGEDDVVLQQLITFSTVPLALSILNLAYKLCLKYNSK